jgi:hypothetical protein
MSNTFRGEYDPPGATLVHTLCERCGNGGKDCSETFFDAKGREIPWEVIERNINRIVKLRNR